MIKFMIGNCETAKLYILSYNRYKFPHSATVNAQASFGNMHLLYDQLIQLLSFAII